MTFELSKFGSALSGETGVRQLMVDIGDAMRAAADNDKAFHLLGGGNPGRIPQVEEVFRQSLQSLCDDPSRLRAVVGGYDSPQGDHEFIKAVAELLKRECGWPVSPRNILLTNGSQSAFFMLFNALAGEFADGTFRHIALPLLPEYIGYADVGIGGSLFQANRPKVQDVDEHLFKYRIDFDALNVNESTSAICISRPTNPTGNVVSDEELNRLQELARENNIPLIVDGAYGLPFPGIIFTNATQNWDEQCITCLSLSKLGLPGVRTGIVVAEPDLIDQLTAMNAIMNLATGSFGPGLVRPLMVDAEVTTLSQKYIRPFYEERADQALKWLSHYMGDTPWRVHQPQGAFFLWLWFPGLPISSQALYERLKARRVLVIAGHHFFPGLNDSDWRHQFECIRITYSQEIASVERGIEIIAEEVDRAMADA